MGSKAYGIYRQVLTEKIEDMLRFNISGASDKDIEKMTEMMFEKFESCFAGTMSDLMNDTVKEYTLSLQDRFAKDRLNRMQESAENKKELVEKTIKLMGEDVYHRPIYCKRCGGVLMFKSPGMYMCEHCSSTEYDDYGKVREYLYAHQGASADDIEEHTGVGIKAVRQMLREDKIEECGSKTIMSLSCIRCGKPISSGKLCESCLRKYNSKIETDAREALEAKRAETMKNIKVVSHMDTSNTGKIRFKSV